MKANFLKKLCEFCINFSQKFVSSGDNYFRISIYNNTTKKLLLNYRPEIY